PVAATAGFVADGSTDPTHEYPKNGRIVRQSLMASPAVLAVGAGLKSTLLEGLGPMDLKNILAAARPQQFVANSVIFNQGNPAQYLYLLTKGRARHFFMTEIGR